MQGQENYVSWQAGGYVPFTTFRKHKRSKIKLKVDRNIDDVDVVVN